MQIAVNSENNRISADRAEKGQEYICPICKGEVVLRKGDINIPHFAHKTVCEDKWHYDMSEWHYGMQQRFPEEQREVVVTHNGQIHRADILCGKQVIEFQHSEISAEEIEERTTFYTEAGYDIAWVFDVQEQYNENLIVDSDEDFPHALKYRWKHAKKNLQVLPYPREENKNVVLYLYWIDEDKMECFNKIIWCERGKENEPVYSSFLTPNYPSFYTDSCEEELCVSDFFITRQDLFSQYIVDIRKETGCQIVEKYIGKGYKYNCPITKSWLRLYGEKSCRYCKYCVAMYTKDITSQKQIPLGICCGYPTQVNDKIPDVSEGFEYNAAHF